jgi:hypothetical protein
MKQAYARSIPAAWRRIARMFVALGDEHRQRILLMFEPGERLNVGQIVAASTLSLPLYCTKDLRLTLQKLVKMS